MALTSALREGQEIPALIILIVMNLPIKNAKITSALKCRAKESTSAL
jgi:hypothetical protein